MSAYFYLYGITDLPITTIKGVSSDPHEDLHAVYQEVGDEFSESNLPQNLQNQEWIIEKATQHQQVLDEVAKISAVIPLAFGSIFKTMEALKAKVVEDHSRFAKLLKLIRGKEEWGLKLYYNQKTLKESLSKNHPSVSTIAQGLSSASAGKAFLLKKELEEKLKIVSKDTINSARKSLYDTLSKQFEHLKLLENSSTELDENKDTNVLNLATLATEAQSMSLHSILEQFNGSQKQFGIYVQMTGPWPAYNFVKE